MNVVDWRFNCLFIDFGLIKYKCEFENIVYIYFLFVLILHLIKLQYLHQDLKSKWFMYV